MQIPANPLKPGTTITGKVSWFGGPGDPSAGSSTASGASTSVPGIAVYNRATLGDYWLVRAPNGKQAVVKQTDLGPAPWTNRLIDFTYSSLGHFGYSQQNFPTDAVGKATYLGRTVPANYQQLAAGAQSAAPSAGGTLPQAPTASGGGTATQFDQGAFKQAQQRYVLGSFLSQQGKSDPWQLKIPGAGAAAEAPSNPLLTSGLATVTAPNPADFTKTVQLAHGALSKVAGPTPLVVPAASRGKSGYVNPIPGATLGRTDMGVDANLPSGHPILAIGDSRVVNIYPNWYQGQPYVLFQLTSGPAAGKYYYIAEAINPTVHPGQTVRAGQTVGTYNSGGTGLELGWGTPGSQTQAQATTGYHEGEVTPAGVSFRNFLGKL